MIDCSLWNERDLNQYFSNTFLGLRQGDQVVPVFVNGIARIYGSTDTNFHGTMERKEIIIGFNNKDLVVTVPESQFVNTSYEACYLTRRTERQYKKGIKERQFNVNHITRHMPDYIIRPQFRKNLVHGLLNDTVRPYDEVLSLIQNGRILSGAFHKHFALGVEPNIEGIILYYKGLTCGFLDDKFQIKLEEDFTELEDKLIDIL